MTTSVLKIGIAGCAGRMGRMLMHEVLATKGAVLSAGTEQAGPHVGQDLGVLAGGVAIGCRAASDASEMFTACDAVIDFTAPAATLAHARLAQHSGKIFVVGTTGLGADVQAAITAAAGKAPVVQAANFSLGMNVLFALTERIAATLTDDYDIDVLEMHHRHKADAPSGTALALGEAAAKGRGVSLANVGRRTRDGITGARPRGEIGFATLRGGDVVGDHTVIFAADGERVEVTHKASSRSNFAKGAIKAALWARGRAPGLYTMRDVLGL
jgi:4-hydroxy-tetrahydrodipicolinate reductase